MDINSIHFALSTQSKQMNKSNLKKIKINFFKNYKLRIIFSQIFYIKMGDFLTTPNKEKVSEDNECPTVN